MLNKLGKEKAPNSGAFVKRLNFVRFFEQHLFF